MHVDLPLLQPQLLQNHLYIYIYPASNAVKGAAARAQTKVAGTESTRHQQALGQQRLEGSSNWKQIQNLFLGLSVPTLHLAEKNDQMRCTKSV